MKRWLVRVSAQLAVSAAFLSCGLAAQGETSAGETEGNDVGPGGTQASTIDGDTRVTLQRTLCFGSCPVYSLSITGDGTVSYVGEMYVRVEGSATKRVPTSDVQALVDQMLEADYFSLSVPESCNEGVFSDAPSVTTSLTLRGQTHTVSHYHGNPCAPDALRTLEDAIDIAARSAEWVQCDNPDGFC